MQRVPGDKYVGHPDSMVWASTTTTITDADGIFNVCVNHRERRTLKFTTLAINGKVDYAAFSQVGAAGQRTAVTGTYPFTCPCIPDGSYCWGTEAQCAAGPSSKRWCCSPRVYAASLPQRRFYCGAFSQ